MELSESTCIVTGAARGLGRAIAAALVDQGARVVQLASGKADALTGRYILATEGLDALVAQADRIVEKDLWTLRIRQGDRG